MVATSLRSEGGCLKVLLKTLTLATLAVAIFNFPAKAQTQEAPPMEPPYTNDSEFDPILGEDPTATNSPVPVSPGIDPVPEARPAPETKTSETKTQDQRPVTARPPYRKGQPVEKGVKLIKHPDAKKGLMRIEADGTYVYKVKTTPKDKSGIVRFGFMNPPNIVSADGTTDFKGMYTSEDLFTLMIDYEWQPFSKYGKFGVQTGLGFATATGNGRFLVPDAAGSVEALETYNFFIVPLNLGLIYRLEFFKSQWLVPYLSGGGSYIGVVELRDDGKSNFTGTPAAYGAGGLMFNITAFDKEMAFNLDSEYGVGNLWLVAEYRFQKAFSEELDFTGGIMSLGISADF